MMIFHLSPVLYGLFFALLVIVVAVVVAVRSLIRKYQRHTRYKQQLWQWHVQNPDPRQQWASPPPARPSRSLWSAAGTVLAAIAAVGGLTILAAVLLVFVALSSGSFKFGNK